jgi:hypothetical protein
MIDGWMGLAVRNPERDGEIDAGLATNVDISSFASAAITYIINGIFREPVCTDYNVPKKLNK